MKKLCFYDIETANDISIIGFKNFESMGFACGCLGYKNSNGEYIKDHSLNIREFFIKLTERIKDGYTLAGFNNIGFDNNVLSHQLRILDAADFLEIQIGGTKGDTLWKDVDTGWLEWCVKNKAGQYAIAKAILDYRNGVNNENKKTVKQIKEYLDSNSIDLMLMIDEATGENYSTNLDSVTRLTINEEKNGSGKDVHILYKNKEFDKIINYCENDVKLVSDLYDFIEKYKYVNIPLYKKYGKLLDNICLKIKLNLE